MNLPVFTAICATAGRHTCLERVVKFFLDQDYDGKHTLLIYNNSEVIQHLGEIELTEYKKIILSNSYIDSQTNQPYKTLGAIYNDAIKDVESDTEVISFFDDDDIFLPSHISKGIEGYNKALEFNKVAYKPAFSFYRSAQGINRVSNTLEPSIFVNFNFLKKFGFSNSTSDQHLAWVNPLVYEDKILVDYQGEPTLVYNWGDSDIPTWKTSGDPHNPNNFQNYRSFSIDHGDQIITPISNEEIEKYYSQVEEYKVN